MIEALNSMEVTSGGGLARRFRMASCAARSLRRFSGSARRIFEPGGLAGAGNIRIVTGQTAVETAFAFATGSRLRERLIDFRKASNALTHRQFDHLRPWPVNNTLDPLEKGFAQHPFFELFVLRLHGQSHDELMDGARRAQERVQDLTDRTIAEYARDIWGVKAVTRCRTSAPRSPAATLTSA